MGRQIDVDNMTVDDVAHLRQRPWLVDEAKQVHGVDDIEERMDEVEQKAADEEKQVVESGDYESLNWAQLRELAASRNLDRSGKKAELVQRLKEDDEYQAERSSASDESDKSDTE
jgi:SAP domain-containing protein